MVREEVYAVLNEERDYQKRVWRDTDGTEKMPPGVGDWLVYMDEYLDRAKNALTTEIGDEAALHMVRKLTALGVACLEQFGAPRRP